MAKSKPVPRSRRTVDRVDRALIRDFFKDGEWRSMSNMCAQLAEVVPDYVATRATLGMRRLERLSLDKRARCGLRKLVNIVVSAMVLEGRCERKSVSGESHYRLKPELLSTGHVASAAVTDDDLQLPGKTKSGLTRPVVAYVICKSPDGITETELIKKLDKCFKETIVDDYEEECLRKEPIARESIPRTELVRRARHHFLREAVLDLAAGGFITRQTETIFRPTKQLQNVK